MEAPGAPGDWATGVGLAVASAELGKEAEA